MYIRQTTHKNQYNSKTYATYKLIRGYRNADGKVRQETVLNLGTSFSIPKNHWKSLTDRIEQLVSGTQQLFALSLPKELENQAQSLAKQVIKKQKTLEAEGIKQKEVREVRVAEGYIPDHQTVNIDSTEDSDVRFIGTEYLGKHAVDQLGLRNVLIAVGFNQKQADIAIANIISRLVCPASELRTHRYLTLESALDEVLGTEFANLKLKALYAASDRLHDHKRTIEDALYQREQSLFGLSEVITLFDITNTYFEGHLEHSDANRSRSKEKRSDCELVSLGILLDGSGFPKKSKILPGNISEPSTLKDMLSDMDNCATVIMDADIATQDNLEYLKTNGYKYIVVRRDSNLTMPENIEPLLVKDTLHNKVSVSLIRHEENIDEVDLYCHSTAKEAQSKMFTDEIISKLEEELVKLNLGLKFCDLETDVANIKADTTAIILNNGEVYVNGNKPINMLIKLNTEVIELADFSKHEQMSTLLQNNQELLTLTQAYSGQVRAKSKVLNKLRNLFTGMVEETKQNTTRAYTKVLEKVGRLKEQYKSVAYMYEINVLSDAGKQNATLIEYKQKKDKLENKQLGVYCLTSNRTNLDADTLWHIYTMLTDLEAEFRSLKSELGMRPVYHQLEHRVDSHIFISILAYHLLHTIRYQLKQKGIHHSWEKIRNIMSTQVRTTTSQDLECGGVVKIRKTSRATVEQMEIYNALGISSTTMKLEKSYFLQGVKKE